MATKNLGPVTAYAYYRQYCIDHQITPVSESAFQELLGSVSDEIDKLEGMTVSVTTGSPGSSASASYNHSTGVLSLTIPRGDAGAQGPAGASSTTATLLSNVWTNNEQTVNVTGVTASNTVIVAPTPASMDDYTNAGIYCSAQGSGTLTFICDIAPSSAITVNVVIVG